uniref:CSON003540 protein n=1 Tax=Culicoides sonorensis TaxID=179676 RepID=A0A336MLN7_CULSO
MLILVKKIIKITSDCSPSSIQSRYYDKIIKPKNCTNYKTNELYADCQIGLDDKNNVNFYGQRPVIDLKNLQDILNNSDDTSINKKNTLLDKLPQLKKTLQNRAGYSLYVFNEKNR